MADLPRMYERSHGSRLVTRKEAAHALGYSVTSMATIMGRGGWPTAVALLKVGRSWRMLWDLDELLAVAPPASASVKLGSVATISDPDGLLTCLECGKRFRSLGRHLNSAHGMTGAEYRDAHRLPATGALAADGVRESGRESLERRRSINPDALTGDTSQAHLDAIRDPARVSETRKYKAVRDAQQSGQRYAVRVMLERRRQALEANVVAHGYDSVEDAIRQTAHLPSRKAAEATGLGASTILRWRRQVT